MRLLTKAGDMPSSVAAAAKLALRAAMQNTCRSSSWKLSFTVLDPRFVNHKATI